MTFRFPGQYEDAETGLHYNRFRYYHPELGRYLSPDPLGQAASPNLYDYAGQSPLIQIDPLGLYREVVHYHLTKVLALEANLRLDVAELIAVSNQGMDEIWSLHPFNVATGTWRHFRDPDAVQFDLFLALLRCNPVAFGRHLHSFQDTFSHEGFYWPWTLGHVPYSIEVKIYNYHPFRSAFDLPDAADPDDWNPTSKRELDMEKGTRDWLRLYSKRCQCQVKPQ